jgi:hypothetical protein
MRFLFFLPVTAMIATAGRSPVWTKEQLHDLSNEQRDGLKTVPYRIGGPNQRETV